MKFKVLSAVLVLIMSALFFSSCAGEKKENDTSSKTAEKEYSSQVTSVENEASSKKEEISSIKEDSSKNEEASQKETSSKKFQRPSETESGSVKVTVDPSKTKGIGVYHFSPGWADHYAEKPTDDQRYEEFEDVLKSGYFNTVVGVELEPRFWEICEKYEVSVWMNIWTLYDTKSSKPEINNLEKYVANIDKTISVIKANPKWWSRFQGFFYDEPIWRGQKNEDYLAITRTLYQKYGKRNFPVFATGVLIGVEGNELQLGQTADANKKVLPFALEYTTDVAYDSYSVDVRDGASNGGYIERVRKEANLPGIVDGKSYYREIANSMLRITGHPANIWFFPTAYRTNLWGGLNGDTHVTEEFSVAMLDFMRDLLEEYDYQGGLMLYNYQKFSNAHALAEVLVVKDENGRNKLCPEGYEGKKWNSYCYLIKEITKEYKANEARVLKTLDK